MRTASKLTTTFFRQRRTTRFSHPDTKTRTASWSAAFSTRGSEKLEATVERERPVDSNNNIDDNPKSFSNQGRILRPRATSQKAAFFDTLFDGNDNDAPRLLKAKTESLLAFPVGKWTTRQWHDAAQAIRLWTPVIDFEDEDEVHYRRSSRRARRRKQRQRRQQQKHSEDSTQQQHEHLPFHPQATAEGVISSFALLERLLVEHQRQNTNNNNYSDHQNDSQSLSKLILNNQLLEQIVANWSIVWMRLHRASSHKPSYKTSHHQDAESQAKVLLEYSPDAVLSRIQAYQTRSHGLLTPNNPQNFESIMLAAAASKQIGLVGIKMLDQLAQQDYQIGRNDNHPWEEPFQEKDEEKASHGQLVLTDKDLEAIYFRFIQICAKSGDAEQAEACLEHMYKEWKRSGSEHLQPRTKFFNFVLQAWKESGGDPKIVSERCQKILKRMMDLSEMWAELEGICNPNHESFRLVLGSLERSLAEIPAVGWFLAKNYSHVGETAKDLLSQVELCTGYPASSSLYHVVLRVLAGIGDAEGAEVVLQDMYDNFKKKKNRRAQPNRICFILVLNAWRNHLKVVRATNTSITDSVGGGVVAPEVGERAEAILRRMQELDRSGELRSVSPDAGTYFAVLQCWAHTFRKDSGERALALLKEMKEKSEETGEQLFSPSVYSSAVQAFAGTGDTKNAEKLSAELFSQLKTNETVPSGVKNLTNVINSWAKSNAPEAPRRAEEILQEMWKLFDDGKLRDPPNVVTYCCVLECYARAGTLEAAVRAEEILADMQRMYKEGKLHHRPTTVAYRFAMQAYSAVGNVEKTEAIYAKMLDDYNKRGNESAKPNPKVHNVVLNAMVNSNREDAPRRAISFLKQLEHQYAKGKLDAPPDVVGYSIALNAFAKSKDPEAGMQAERLLNELEERASNGEPWLAPNTASYSSVIHIYGLRGQPEEAEALLERMHKTFAEGSIDVRPNVRTFTSVILAWTRSKKRKAPRRAMAILEWMKKLHRTGALNDIKPNFITYSTVLGSIAHSQRKDGLKLGLSLLDEMNKLADEGDENMRPNIVCYNIILAICGRLGEGRHAQQLVAQMLHQYEIGKLSDMPDASTWMYTLKAWSRSSDPDATSRAETVMKRFLELHKLGRLNEGPDLYAYSHLLTCYLSSKRTCHRKYIEPILDEMDILAAKGDNSLNPPELYRMIFDLSKTNDPELLLRAESVLERLVDAEAEKLKFSITAYKTLISTWKKFKGMDARKHAKRLRDEFDELKPATHNTSYSAYR